jgi:hypothetical protein
MDAKIVRAVRGAGILTLFCTTGAIVLWDYLGHRTAGIVSGSVEALLGLYMIFAFGPVTERLQRRFPRPETAASPPPPLP